MKYKFTRISPAGHHLSERGQMQIPAELLEEAKIPAGSEVIVVARQGSLLVELSEQFDQHIKDKYSD